MILFPVLLALAVSLIVVPAVQVILTRRGSLKGTPLMKRRRREARASGKTDFEIDFRWLDLDQISHELVKAVIAVEDPAFLVHHGINFRGVRSAISELLHTGKVTFGFSTITNQIARNVFLTLRKHYWRKALEFVYTIFMELIWGKRRIIEVYLNLVEMGDGVFGCAAAARHHFDKDARDLTLHESILLSVALRNPRRFSPAQFTAGSGWWTDYIASCEWLAENWKVPADETIWNVKGDDAICGALICRAADFAKHLSTIAALGLSADEMIAICREVSSDFSAVGIGELLWTKGRAEFYCEGALAEGWTLHGKFPYLDYAPPIPKAS